MSNKKGKMRERHPGLVQRKQPVEVINKPTRDQMIDQRIAEVEAKLNEHDERMLELRSILLDVRKELTQINKKK
jgi:hypothetical protein